MVVLYGTLLWLGQDVVYTDGFQRVTATAAAFDSHNRPEYNSVYDQYVV